jgi:hypothetical protein
VLLGFIASDSATVTVVLLSVAAATLAIAFGLEILTTMAVALLPWLVLLINLTPRLTLTLSSAAAVLLLLLLAPPRSGVGHLPWFSCLAFLAIIIAHAASATTSSQLQEAAKYSLFPVMALLVISPDGRRRFVTMRPFLMASGMAVMVVQASSILLHFGASNTYYGSGEQLGLTAESPHELALIGVMLAIACLISIKDFRWRIIGAGVAAAPALATGVRSALVALAVGLLLLAVRTRFKPSTVLAIACVFAVIIASGVGQIVVNRYQLDQTYGQYSSFAAAGSGRGALWTTALDRWVHSTPVQMFGGHNFRAVETIEQQSLGEAVTAQSDPVTILLELGILGFGTWLLIWLAILRSGVNWLVLVPLGVYSVISGSIEYLGAVIFGLALSAALSDPQPVREASVEEPARAAGQAVDVAVP